MVLKNLVRYIINKYLKDYIEQLDYEKLKLDLKNGHVCLEKLHLKPEALVDLSLPVTVAVGYLEKLTLIISWKNLYNNPTKVSIDGLYMLVVPKNEVRRDLTDYYDDKMRRVQRKVDNLRKAAANNKKLDEKETTFLERMRLQIMQNLHITIDNLHISYETISTTKLGHPFSFGLTIEHLEMTTTTNNRSSGRHREHSSVVFKMNEMRALALYWNTKCQSRINMAFDDVVKDLKLKIASHNRIPEDTEMNYILYPMDPAIDLTIVFQPGEFNFERPAYKIDIQLERLDLNIDPKQFSDLLDFIKFQNYSKLYDRCREYRELQIQQTLNTQALTFEQKERLQYLESKLDVFNLAYIRHQVETETHPALCTKHHYRSFRRHSKSNRTAAAPVSPSHHHHKWWNSWWKGKSHPNEERRKSSVCESSVTNGEVLSDDSPNIDIEVKGQYLALNLLLPQAANRSSPTDKDILCPIQITNARIDFERRAVSSNVLFRIDLQSLSLFGTRTGTQQRALLVTAVPSPSLPLIHCELELSPLDKKSDYRLCLAIEPLKITYDAPTINQIVRCFDSTDDKLCLTMPSIKQRTVEEMEQEITRTKVFDMAIQLQSISLVLPMSDQRCSSTITMMFESLALKSSLDDHEDDNAALSQNEALWLRFYKKYKLKLANLQIVYSHPGHSLHAQILRSTSILDANFFKCIFSDDRGLVNWRISASIATMGRVQLSRMILMQLIQHLQSVPSLYSDMMESLHRINLYFAIFPPCTTITVGIAIRMCSLRLMDFSASVNTDICAHVSTMRDKKDMTITLNNLTMSHHSEPSSPRLFYRNNSIELNYSNDLINEL